VRNHGMFDRREAPPVLPRRLRLLKLANFAAAGSITLLYAARDEAHNHALVLADYMRKLRAGTPSAKR
jgi:hypothetical protein